jgi:DNA-binding transcriptional regulator PaaX
VLLDLLRVSDEPAPVSGLVHVGELFGFTGNAIRVALARLVSGGLVESDERGWYRLAPDTDSISEWVEWWREGDRRRRRWSGAWLMCWLPRRAPARGARKGSLRALARTGFVEGLPGARVRPDNLAGGVDQLRDQLDRLGLEDGATVFAADQLDEATRTRWSTELWPVAKLQRDYAKMLDDLTRSRARVPTLPAARAMVETFLLGGAAIRMLARDPLLPESIMNGDTRRDLTAEMRAYDRIGRRTWRDALAGRDIDRAPSHLAVLEGGRP